jgi:4-nitrophenyl phosphatase
VETLYAGEPGCRDVDAVFVGWHPECGMKDIEAACEAIWAGAKLYVASDVPFFASKQGRSMGYSYAIVGAIRRVTKSKMVLTGKPSLHALRYVAGKLGIPCRNVGVVGDDPEVETVMAKRGGAVAMAVTTGITKRHMWSALPAAKRPHLVMESLMEILPHVIPGATDRRGCPD